MEILRMAMFETNGTQAMPIRPFKADLRAASPDLANTIGEATEYGRMISPTRLSRLSSGILIPSSEPIHSEIDGGWGEKRIIFAMLVDVSSQQTYADVRYVVGYTDRADYSQGPRGDISFPNDMRLYFNSVTKIAWNEVANRTSAGGRALRPTIMSNDLILNRDSIAMDTVNRRPDTRPSLMRPYDVYTRASSNEIGRQFEDHFQSGIIGTNVLTGSFAKQIALSSRSHNNSTKYLASSLGKYMEARATANDDASVSGFLSAGEDISHDSEAGVRLIDNSIEDDVMFDTVRNMSDILDTGFVEWNELQNIFPDFERQVEMPFITWDARVRSLNRKYRDTATQDRKYVAGASGANDSGSFYEATAESTCALIMSQSIPEILMNGMYASMQGIVIDSHPQMGEPQVIPGIPVPFMDGVPVSYGYNYFRDQLQSVVLPNITRNGALHVRMLINADIGSDVEVWVTIDGGREEHFVYPAWGEGLVPPIITNRIADLDQMADTLSGLSSDYALTCEKNSRRDIDKVTSIRELFADDRNTSTITRMRPGSQQRDDIDIIL